MENVRELKTQIVKIVANTKVPNGISKILGDIQLQYDELCKQCINSIVAIQNNDKSSSMISLIKSDMDEMKDFIKYIIENQYIIKNTKMLENILQEFESLSNLQTINVQELKNTCREIIIDNNDNKIFVSDMVHIIKSELYSFKSKTQMQISTMARENKKTQVKEIKEQLCIDIETIIKNLCEETNEVNSILAEQEEEIYVDIENVIDEFIISKNNSQSREKKFRENLAQNVNIQKQTVIENDNYKSLKKNLEQEKE